LADPNYADVSLLLHCNGTDASTTFTDSGPVGHTVTANGNAQLDTAQQKWGTAAALFDSTTDYLTVPNHTSLELATGDFTIEFWVRLADTSAGTLMSRGSVGAQWSVYYDGDVVNFLFNTNEEGPLAISGTNSLSSGVWYHVAVVRNGDDITIYDDGDAGQTAPLSGTDDIVSSTATLAIGAHSDGSDSINAWLDDIRITKGVARYTAAFTPPTAEFSDSASDDVTGYIAAAAILGGVDGAKLFGEATQIEEQYFANVKLLLHCDGSDASTTFTDNSSLAHTVTANGNAQIDTAQSKWGGASGLFDGTGDYLTVPDHADLILTSGDWTVECWLRLNSLAANAIIMQRAVGTGIYPWQFWFDSSTAKFGFRGFNTSANTEFDLLSSVVTTGVWYHLAGVRDGNTMRFFLDGVSQGTDTVSIALATTSSTSLSIGAANTGSTSFNGWIDDVRITKGTARYTANFTPPTAAFPNGNNVYGYVSTAHMMGAPALLGGTDTTGSISTAAIIGAPVLFGFQLVGSISAPAILGGTAGAAVFGSLVYGFVSSPAILVGSSVEVTALHDFSASVVDRPTQYVMDLLTDEEADTRVRVPISSWQGTQQTDNDSYLGCVVPACSPWLETLDIATHFIISRRVTLDDGSVLESEMARSPLETLQTDEGPTNYTASLSGYSDPYTSDADPDAARDRTLQGIRSISVYESGVRIRCAIDWFLRPAQRAFYGETSFIVSYINYYVTANTASVDEYMDVGERIAEA
jgi:hypothetical protein